MPVEDILPDPDNPREPFENRTPEEQAKQLELNRDVGERGVKSPISIRPHPTIPGKWIINFGHNRYHAVLANGLKTIPYFVDEKFDSYDQVNENELRSNLSPWALAAFVARKIKDGEVKGQVADRLRKNQNVITELLALVDPPTCLHQAYMVGVKSPRTLYDLRRAYDEFPDQIEAWVASGARITRDTIKEQVEKLRHDVIAANEAPAQPAVGQSAPPTSTGTTELRHDVIMTDTREPVALPTPQLRHDVKPASSPAPRETQKPELRHDVKTPQVTPKSAAPLASAKPSTSTGEIMVQYKGKPARIAPGTTVKIVVDGLDATMEVLLSDLVFKP
jgi:ParB family chromosome partitioning protein